MLHTRARTHTHCDKHATYCDHFEYSNLYVTADLFISSHDSSLDCIIEKQYMSMSQSCLLAITDPLTLIDELDPYSLKIHRMCQYELHSLA